MNNHVVLVDDDLVNRKIAQKILSENNIEAVTLASGQELLDYLRHDTPDLILLDIMMKGMDGYEVLNTLKANDQLKMIPVVFLTGMTDEMSECRGLEMDVVDYLKKPVVSKVLFARVQHYLDLYAGPANKGTLDEYNHLLQLPLYLCP